MTATHRNWSEGGAGLGMTQALAETRKRIILGIEKSTERLGQRREPRQGRVHHDADTGVAKKNVTTGTSISNVDQAE